MKAFAQELNEPSGSNLTCDIETSESVDISVLFPFLPQILRCDPRQNTPKHEDFLTYHGDGRGVSVVSWWLLELGSI